LRSRLANDADQLASLQSPEFLQGARLDEPRWAAFWQTLALDTAPKILREQAEPERRPNLAKLYLLMKRRPDLDLNAFQDALVADRIGHSNAPAGLLRHLVNFARPSLYGLGEPRFDAVEVLSFDDANALAEALGAGAFSEGLRSGWPYLDSRYLFVFPAQEHWVIRPGER
jgi:hypothetical protein